MVGFGFVLRNDKGCFVAAKNGCSHGLMEPLIAESLSCREALNWLKRNGHQHVILESDCQSLVSVLHGSHVLNSTAGLIIKNCKF